MKRIMSLLILLVFTSSKGQPITNKHNKIDDINSSIQVNELLHKLLGNDYNNYYIPDKLSYKDEQYRNFGFKVNATPWAKADFDNNGYTDLLVIAQDTTDTFMPDSRYIACIMDSGVNKFYIKRLTSDLYSSAVASCSKIVQAEVPAILYFHLEAPEYTLLDDKGNKIPNNERLDTLTYKFDDFIEYCKKPKKFTINKIQFETSMCFGTCPSFKITINNDGVAEYEAKVYNEDRQGKAVEGIFKTKIDPVSFTEIINLLSYVNFPALKNKYAVNWTDDQTGTLTITYNGGKKKAIHDYGQQGTFGLRRLYEMLTALRLNQNWH